MQGRHEIGLKGGAAHMTKEEAESDMDERGEEEELGQHQPQVSAPALHAHVSAPDQTISSPSPSTTPTAMQGVASKGWGE